MVNNIVLIDPKKLILLNNHNILVLTENVKMELFYVVKEAKITNFVYQIV